MCGALLSILYKYSHFTAMTALCFTSILCMEKTQIRTGKNTPQSS